MYRQIIIPDSNSFLLSLPIDFIGKQVEVIAFTVEDIQNKKRNRKNTSIATLHKYFSEIKFDVKKLKLSRDEANER